MCLKEANAAQLNPASLTMKPAFPAGFLLHKIKSDSAMLPLVQCPFRLRYLANVPTPAATAVAPPDDQAE